MLRCVFTVAGLLFAGPVCAADPPKVTDLVRQLESGAPGERVIAAEQLGDLGPAAAEAIPALSRAAQTARRLASEGDAETRRAGGCLYQAALDALVGIGAKSAPALMELMVDQKGEIHGEVGWLIAELGQDAAPVAPALAKLLAHDSQDMRVFAAGILAKLGPGAEKAAPELVALFLNPTNKHDQNLVGSSWLPPPPRVAAVLALVRIGPKAVPAITDKILPVLAEEVKTGEFGPAGSSADVLSVLGEAGAPLVPALATIVRKGEDGLHRMYAGKALLGLGPTGRKAFAELLAKETNAQGGLVLALRDYDYHSNGRFPHFYRPDAPALDLMPFVPGLVATLKNPEVEDRLIAADFLCDHPTKVPAAARDAIIELLRDPAVKELLTKYEGYWRLPRIGRFGEPGFRTLATLLDSDSVYMRKFAVEQLRGSRQWSAVALPKLRTLAHAPDVKLALDAAYTAAWLSFDPKDAAPLAGRRFLRRADPEIRAEAATRLEWLGPVGVPHLDALVPLLDDKDEEINRAAAWAIQAGAPKGSAAARALAERKRDRDGAGTLIPELQPEHEPRSPGVPELIDVLRAVGDAKRVGAAFDLGDRGAAAKDAVPALKKLLLDPDAGLRFAAAYALARITGDTPALRRLMAGELERLASGRSAPRFVQCGDPEPDTATGPFVGGRPGAWIAAYAFGRLPPDFPELIPVAARCLERYGDLTAVMSGLEKYGPKAKAAVPALRKVLRREKEPLDAFFGSELKPACSALRAIGPDARDALPELRQLFDSSAVELAMAAGDAIRTITGEK
ncbi:Armadillo/beta-catenin-like repeat protein [Gemmata obscuriglobus]|uniref:HEAT repeat domain-containing protein n=1 Tax=Gemmata obscuriglobus TaxID=114 RepID=A0A2Z3H0Y3_9BACT|nr:HEAT repeat domain-containing protein [Gemmata obscuriglobus]AWM37982.1 hypothetical protein C1280_13930 [Gemmata obscuriglobus]QEG29157.1 Armadillo/beta-catenin-like repeat protein [Gemmata obscuriglobus]VTS07889.1 signal transduction protein containing nacht domain : HEAT repeat-containing protein OS=Leptolyngbya sp. PCC 7375 GN=Lepto7375DRAFT_2567 PE=4 SV=1: HEAT_2 [Gemmata obscuriglobus UQM 2246]